MKKVKKNGNNININISIHMQNGLNNVCEFIDIMWKEEKNVSYYRRQLAKEYNKKKKSRPDCI